MSGKDVLPCPFSCPRNSGEQFCHTSSRSGSHGHPPRCVPGNIASSRRSLWARYQKRSNAVRLPAAVRRKGCCTRRFRRWSGRKASGSDVIHVALIHARAQPDKLDCGANTTFSSRFPLLSKSTSNTSWYSPFTVSPSSTLHLHILPVGVLVASFLEFFFLSGETLNDFFRRDALGLRLVERALVRDSPRRQQDD